MKRNEDKKGTAAIRAVIAAAFAFTLALCLPAAAFADDPGTSEPVTDAAQVKEPEGEALEQEKVVLEGEETVSAEEEVAPVSSAPESNELTVLTTANNGEATGVEDLETQAAVAYDDLAQSYDLTKDDANHTVTLTGYKGSATAITVPGKVLINGVESTRVPPVPGMGGTFFMPVNGGGIAMRRGNRSTCPDMARLSA